MKNSLVNMIVVLGAIALCASAGVGYVYKITEKPIAISAENNKKAALAEVLPAFDDVKSETKELDGIPVTVYTATSAGQTVGHAVETATNKGFSGTFKLMVGFDTEGKVRGVKVLQHSETPGLGDKMGKAGNPLFASFEGRNPGEMKMAVKKDGGEVDALTAATITSRAYIDAVARAFNAIAANYGADAVSGATSAAPAVDSAAVSEPSNAEVR